MFVIAILLCLGDNCDLVRPEPEISYASYEECSQAAGTKSDALGKIAAAHREQGRESEIICLHPITPIAELDEEHETLVASDVFPAPEATGRAISNIPPKTKVRVTGEVTGTKWLRIALPNGKSGFVFSERMRKLSFAPPPSSPVATATAPATPNTQAAALPEKPPPQQQALIPPTAPPSAAPPGLSPLQEYRDCDKCPTVVVVPGGTFDMGSSADSTERPIHRVTIGPFALGKFNITQAEWDACDGCSYKPKNDPRLPVSNISWDDAQQYIAWLIKVTGHKYRLPSESEWEYAARAGTTTSYPWGPQVGIAKAGCNGCGVPAYNPKAPAFSGTFPTNPWHFFDMLGVVSQWTDDCWHKNYDGAPNNGAPWPAPRCAEHVLRGGSWKNGPKEITVSSRNFYDTSVRYQANGMRIALTLR